MSTTTANVPPGSPDLGPASTPGPNEPVSLADALSGGLGRYLGSPWPWRALGYSAGTACLGLVLLFGLGAYFTLALITAVVIVGLVLFLLTPLWGIPLSALERRAIGLLGYRPPPNPHRPVPGPGLWSWLGTRYTEAVTWREFAHLALHVVVLMPLHVAALSAWGGCLVMALLPVFMHFAAPAEPFQMMGLELVGQERLPLVLALVVVSLLGVLVCTYLISLLVAGQAWVARRLLAPPRRQAQVRELTRSREVLVDAFEAERNRIERDLHDGAQQQLVSMTVTLGMAELELVEAGAPESARALVARAHGEAKDTLAELRALVRGIHPQVLTDHGLADAVREIAARSPIPVTVAITLAERPPREVETAAYFITAEALTNVVKHSRAGAAQVHGWRAGNALHLSISDDGVGGATDEVGTGLRGLAERAAVLGGTLTLTSPEGGPTVLTVEIPCQVPATA